MVKSLSLNAQNAVSSEEGLEPVVQVFIDWGSGLRFATKDVGIWDGRILSFNGVTTQRKRNNSAGATSVTITLDDSDGLIYNFIKITDIEKSEARVYQYFDGTTGSATTEIFRGVVSTPVIWSEGQRTVKITIESYIESGQVGFSIEEGEFGVNNQVAVGKMWPLVYGKAAHVPAVLAQRQPNSVLKYSMNMGSAVGEDSLFELINQTVDGVTVKDLKIKDTSDVATFEDGASLRFGKIYVEDGSGFPQDQNIDVIVNGVIFNGSFSGNTFSIQEANAPKYQDLSIAVRPATDPDHSSPNVFWLVEDKSIVNHYIEIDIGDFTYKRYVTHQEGKKCWIQDKIFTLTGGRGFVTLDTRDTIKTVRALDNGLNLRLEEFANEIKEIYKRRAVRKNSSSSPYSLLEQKLELIKFIRDAFWSAKEGTRIRQWGGPKEIYVANAVSSNEVSSVYGVRTIDGKEQFVPIPKDYYTVVTNKSTNISSGNGPQTVTTVEFQNPLYSFKGQEWEDDIYVTVDSTLTNNPANIISNLITGYTNLTVDSTNFSNVASNLTPYPANFALLEKWEAIKLAEEIAWQARCALIYDGPDVKIKYLSKDPSSDFTLDETNTEFQSLETGSSDEVEVYTELRGIYHRTLKPEIDPSNTDRRVYWWRANTESYGYKQRKVDIFIFNHQDLVSKTIKFWGNRYANVWRLVTVKCFHDAMKLEPFDTVTLSYTDSSIIGTSNIKGVVKRIRNKVMDGIVELEIWLPAVVGTSSENSLAWLDDSGDSAPSNIANEFKEIDYNIQDSDATWTIDDALEHLKEIRRKTVRPARIKSIE